MCSAWSSGEAGGWDAFSPLPQSLKVTQFGSYVVANLTLPLF